MEAAIAGASPSRPRAGERGRRLQLLAHAGEGPVYVNLNCVEEIDRAAIGIVPFDGRAI